jgi:LysR family transcriptional regulator, cyn operon transcriptional activator
MDLHQLRVFRAAALNRNFTRAAEELRISQSTVSLHVKNLEEELGARLFLRVGRKVVLTDSGAMLLNSTERVLRDLKNAEAAVREMGAVQHGSVRLGVGATTLIYRLPDCLSAFRRRFPGIDVIIETGTTELLLQHLQAQRLDLVVAMQPVAGHNLRVTPLGSEEMVVVLHRDHPAARKRALDAADLAGLSFILYEKRTAMQNVIDEWFASLGVEPRVNMEMENIEAIKCLVRSGFGASVLPFCAVSKRAAGDTLRALHVRGKPLFRHLGLVSLEADALPNSLRILGEMIVRRLTAGRRPSIDSANRND